MENLQSNPPNTEEYKDPEKFIDYLMAINDPVQVLREGTSWIELHGATAAKAPEVYEFIVETVSRMLKDVDSRRLS